MTQLSVRPLALFLLLALAASVHGQTPAPPAMLKPASDAVRAAPMRVDVVIARYQGDKRISSLPYTMSVNAAARGVGQLRMGADIPISTTIAPPADPAKPGPAAATVNYDQIGTSIDCFVKPTDDGRYQLELTVSDKSVYADGEGPAVNKPRGNPTFRSFRSTNAVVLRDGQTAQFTAATDRVTGEVVRVEVTLHLVK